MPRSTKQTLKVPAARRQTPKARSNWVVRKRVRIRQALDRHALQTPAQNDTAAWVRMLAAARGADMIQSDGLEEIEANPLTRLRLATLLPVANELYEENVARIANEESRQIAEIIVHCQEFVAVKPPPKKKGRVGNKEETPKQWSKTDCDEAAGNLHVPALLRTLLPARPDVIGLQLTPQSSAWRLLRMTIHRDFTDTDQRRSLQYGDRLRWAIRHGNRNLSVLLPLREKSFVDAVLKRAPPLVQALPPQWASADTTDDLHNALLALLQLPPKCSLGRVVKRLSDVERHLLVKERWCLSEILDSGTWASDCAKGRDFEEYVAFVSFLRNDSSFQGSLADVPPEPPSAHETRAEIVPNSGTQCARKKRGALPTPLQTDMTAWAHLIAAARGADMLQSGGIPDTSAYLLTRSRLRTLLPIARHLYQKRVLSAIASPESRQIDEILDHCQEFLGDIESFYKKLGMDYKPSPKLQWNQTLCKEKASNLVVPSSPKTVRPVPPHAIGVHMTPKSSVWRLLRTEINRRLKRTDRRLGTLYNKKLLSAISRRLVDQSTVQPLRKESFLTVVLEHAPPLFRLLPLQWTAADRTNELLDALLALARLGRTRALVRLVNILSDAEYDLLVKEHACLSRILVEEDWPSDCAEQRSLEEYHTFVLHLRENIGFKGSLSEVPPKRSKAEMTGDKRARLSGEPELSVCGESSTFPEASGADWVSRGARKCQRVTIAQQAASAPGDWDDDDFDEPLDLDLDEDDNDELLVNFPVGSAASDNMVWSPMLQIPTEHGDSAGVLHGKPWESLWEPVAKAERPASPGGPLARSDGAIVVSLGLPLAAGAVAALGLVLLLLGFVFYRRIRRVTGDGSRARAVQR